AARLVAGWPLVILGLIGGAIAILQRQWWPLLLLLLCPLFYLWSLHSGGVDLYVPTLWPFTSYNTRYALPALALACFCASALTTGARNRGVIVLTILIMVGIGAIGMNVVCWNEARVNSAARRDAQAQAAAFLKANYHEGSGLVMSLAQLAST